jgi:N utilization substance protein A
MVVTELRGEKIDIVPFSEDQPDFVAKALSPAKVKEVRIHEDTGVAEVIVPDFQLSLAIGREGQNARLAARLTGWRVDIKSETQRAEEDAGIFRSDERYEREEGVEYAEGEWVPNPASGELEWHAADGTVISAQEWAEGGAEAGAATEPAAGAEAAAGTEIEVEASPTDATAEEAAGATEEAAEEAIDEEAAIEADLDPIQDAEDAEEADLEAEAEADVAGGADEQETAGDG